MKWFHIFLSALGFALPALADSTPTGEEGDSATVWRLSPEVKVDSSGIFLNQIVSSTPPVVLPQIRLASAPPPGQTTLFSRGQIIAFVQSNAPVLNSTNWAGSARVRVTRRMRDLEETEMTALLLAAFQSNYVKDLGELELHFSQPWTTVSVPDEPLRLTITAAPTAGLNPVFLAGFELNAGTERVGRWQTVLQAKIWRQIPVAHALLTRGQLLSDADLTLERRDILTVHDALLEMTGKDTLEISQSVAVGMPILNRSVRPRPLIKRGQMVDAVFLDGSLKISLKVESLEDGALGQTVRVRNPKTRRELNGKVQNEESVSITL